MADTRLKHKPNEKHTLDEVLKSLNDLVRNEVLDKPRPPASGPKSVPTSAATMDMRDIISSLENLLADDLDVEPKPVASASTETRPANAGVAPKTSPPATTAAELEEAIEAAEATIESELAVSGETPVPEPTIADAAPTLELTIEEPPAAPAKGVQQELPLFIGDPGPSATEVKQAPIPTEVGLPTIEVEETSPTAESDATFASDMAAELETIADEILAAPAPSDTAATNSYSVDFVSDADFAPAENAGAPEEISIEAAPAPDTATATIEYTPSAKTTRETDSADSPAVETVPSAPDTAQTSAPLEDLAAPVQDEPPANEDAILDRSEPPDAGEAPTGDDSGSSLGGVVDFDLSASEPAPAAAPTSHSMATAPPTPVDDIPVLDDVALAPPGIAKPAPASPSSPDRVREMAIKIIARLNIEMRKAGKQPLDAKTINRLQQLLREALEKESESEKSKVKS